MRPDFPRQHPFSTFFRTLQRSRFARIFSRKTPPFGPTGRPAQTQVFREGADDIARIRRMAQAIFFKNDMKTAGGLNRTCG